MSNSSPDDVRKVAETDPRVERTTRALGHALIALVQERGFGDITVQDILDRAGVGRSTFYAHFRNKEDALHASYERMFAGFEALLARAGPRDGRLFPVTEFLEHVGGARRLVEALRRDGQLEDVWSLCTEHAARMIEARLPASPGVATGIVPAVPRPLVARMLAGALVEAMRWWFDHPGATPPAAVDAAFHEHARGAVRRLAITA